MGQVEILEVLYNRLVEGDDKFYSVKQISKMSKDMSNSNMPRQIRMLHMFGYLQVRSGLQTRSGNNSNHTIKRYKLKQDKKQAVELMLRLSGLTPQCSQKPEYTHTNICVDSNAGENNSGNGGINND